MFTIISPWNIVDWNIEEYCGYKPISTYYSDFSIAEKFGKDSIIDTYKRAKKNWFSDYKWLTEIVMVLNWKQWEHNARGNHELVKLYYDLWSEADLYAQEHLKGEELSYFFRTTD